ncbi:MAG: hypothetical protein AM325_013405 [Candidatus Thorarchaeota archaeon SMTZ1-45]|nr:MAG: hypothetical protein AM325_14940 [Candidatus Thorarchaeota archaeon SMTZ1-45]
MQRNSEKPVLSGSKAKSRKRYIVVVGVLIIIGLGVYGFIQFFEYNYNLGGTIVVNPEEYQHWFLPDSHSLDLRRPRWKGVTENDTFSVYFGPSAVIENLIANFTNGFSLEAFSDFLLAEETRYFNNYISIPSAGNWSIIMINPHTYSISVENSLTGLVYPYNIWLVVAITSLVIGYAIAYIKSDVRENPRMEQDDASLATGL